VYKRQEDR